MPDGLIERLAAENVYVAPRLGRMRISPHVYNDEADVDRFVAVMRRVLTVGVIGGALPRLDRCHGAIRLTPIAPYGSRSP